MCMEVDGNGLVYLTGSFGTGPFTLPVDGLPDNTAIYFRAFAVNSMGTGYSQQASFTTYLSGAVPTPQREGLEDFYSSLDGNDLTGNIPEWINKLENLRFLKLYYNTGMTGQIPSSITQLDKLEVLDIRGTGLYLDPTDEALLIGRGVYIRK